MKPKSNFLPAVSAFLLMMAMALTSTALSFFVTPVCADLGIGRGSFTIYYSLMTAAGALSNTFLGQYVNQKGVRGLILVSGFWVAAGLFLFSMSRTLWMFYAVAAALGLFGSSCTSLCANVIVQTCFSGEQASGLLGIVMSGSGVGGMIVSMILPGIIETRGWQFGYRLLSVLWLGLLVMSFLLLGKQETTHAVGHRATPVSGMTRAEAMKSPKLYLLMVSGCIMYAVCGIQQQMPSLLGGMGFDTATVASMMSFLTAALAIGKILQGGLYGRVGIIRGSYIMVLLFAASFLMLMIPGIVYPALIALAFGMGVVTTLMPMVARFAFGPREFAAIWSILATASSVGSFAATPLWGMVYDMTGTYTPALIASSVGLVIALVCLVTSLKEPKKA